MQGFGKVGGVVVRCLGLAGVRRDRPVTMGGVESFFASGGRRHVIIGSPWAITASLLVGVKIVETRALTGSGSGRPRLGGDVAGEARPGSAAGRLRVRSP